MAPIRHPGFVSGRYLQKMMERISEDKNERIWADLVWNWIWKSLFYCFFWNLTSKKNEWYFLLGWVIIMFMLHTYTVL